MISPMYFQPLSFEQNNPTLAGMQSMGDIITQQMKNAYMPQQMQQEMQKQRMANALAQIQLQYAPQMTQAELEMKQSMPGLYKSEAAKNYADVPLEGAQTALTQQQTKFLPLENLLKIQQAAQQSSRFGGAYQQAKALQEMSPAARQTWIANNQNSYNEMLTDLGNRTNINYITPEILGKFFPGINAQNVPANSVATGGKYFSAPTQDQVDQTRLANQIAANNSLVTSPTRRQFEGALQVEGVMNNPDFQSRAINAAQFSGAVGKGQAAVTALKQTNPKAYEDYLSFKNQDLILLKNRIKTLDQMGATDTQRQELDNLYGKTADAFTSNPDQFITQLNNLGNALDIVAKSVRTSANPIFPVNRLSGFSPIKNPYGSSNQFVRVEAPDGQVLRVPADKVSDLLKDHPDHRRIQ